MDVSTSESFANDTITRPNHWTGFYQDLKLQICSKLQTMMSHASISQEICIMAFVPRNRHGLGFYVTLCKLGVAACGGCSVSRCRLSLLLKHAVTKEINFLDYGWWHEWETAESSAGNRLAHTKAVVGCPPDLYYEHYAAVKLEIIRNVRLKLSVVRQIKRNPTVRNE